MNTAGEAQGANRNDLAGSEAEARAAGSRRLLLAGAAGGLALAASGLLLPDWLVEEAAGDKDLLARSRQEQGACARDPHHR